MLSIKRNVHDAQLSYETELENALKNTPGSRRDFDKHYLPDFIAVADWLGASGTHRFGDEGHNHLHIAATIGAEAILLIGDSGYRSWSSANDEPSVVPWTRLVWRRAMVLATGHIAANRLVMDRATGKRWTPLQGPFASAISGTGYEFAVSNRRLDPSACKQSVAQSIYPNGITSDPMHHLAWIDSFAQQPNADNPIYKSLRRAARKCSGALKSVPYWWEELLEGRWELTLNVPHVPPPRPALHSVQTNPVLKPSVPPADPAARFRDISVQLVEQWPRWIADGRYAIRSPDGLLLRDGESWLLEVPGGIQQVCKLMPADWEVKPNEVLRLLVEGELVELTSKGKPRLAKCDAREGKFLALTEDAAIMLELH